MDSFERDLLTRIRAGFGVPVGSRLMVAVSGGPDSVALLAGLSNIASSLQIDILAAHVNHGIRGAESDRDQAFVEELCHQACIPLRTLHVSGVTSAGNLENQLRHQRYRLLFDAADERGATLVTAHHADDQAETVLFKMMRGSGPKGWSGISPRLQDPITGAQLIRPLLHQRRKEILSYLTRRQLEFCTDSTNHSTDLDRNWIRHALLPQISSRLNPRVTETLSRTAHISRELEELLDQLSEEAFPRVCEQLSGHQLAVDVEQLGRLPTALQRWIIRRAITTLRPAARQVGFEHTSAVLRLIKGQSGRQLDLPHGLVACRDQSGLTIRRRRRKPHSFCQPLAIPGDVWIESRRVRVEAGWMEHTQESEPGPSATFLWGGAPLSLRHRRPGDVFCSREGRPRKLKDLLVQERIPFLERDRLIVLSSQREIIWVESLWVRPSRVPGSDQKAVIISVAGETLVESVCLKKGTAGR